MNPKLTMERTTTSVRGRGGAGGRATAAQCGSARNRGQRAARGHGDEHAKGSRAAQVGARGNRAAQPGREPGTAGTTAAARGLQRRVRGPDEVQDGRPGTGGTKLGNHPGTDHRRLLRLAEATDERRSLRSDAGRESDGPATVDDQHGVATYRAVHRRQHDTGGAVGTPDEHGHRRHLARALRRSGVEEHLEANGPVLSVKVAIAIDTMRRHGRSGMLYDSSDQGSHDQVAFPEKHFDPNWNRSGKCGRSAAKGRNRTGWEPGHQTDDTGSRSLTEAWNPRNALVGAPHTDNERRARLAGVSLDPLDDLPQT